MATRFRLNAQGRIKISENDVEEQLRAWFALRGWIERRNHSGLARWWRGSSVVGNPFKLGEAGMPDWTFTRRVLIDGRPYWQQVWIEAKAPGGKLSANQRAWIDQHAEPPYSYQIAVVDGLESLEAAMRGWGLW